MNEFQTWNRKNKKIYQDYKVDNNNYFLQQ